jgi:3-hydroxyisobutyrate dehydrogenase-like beta-hydroxyacid dehydrogenase
MAARLRQAPLALAVYDPRDEPVKAMRELGADGLSSPAEVAAVSDVVGVCVPGDELVLEVVTGEGGLLAGIKPGSLVLIHSTVRPDTCLEVRDRCSEVGVDVLDVAVSGYPVKAAQGTLTLLIGGASEALARCDDYLGAIGDKRFHLGDVGAGAIAKVANNVMAMMNILGVFEALTLARAHGLDLGQMMDAALVSSAASDSLRTWQQQNRSLEEGAGFWEGITPGGHDVLERALTMSRQVGVELPVVTAAVELMRSHDWRIAPAG